MEDMLFRFYDSIDRELKMACIGNWACRSCDDHEVKLKAVIRWMMLNQAHT